MITAARVEPAWSDSSKLAAAVEVATLAGVTTIRCRHAHPTTTAAERCLQKLAARHDYRTDGERP